MIISDSNRFMPLFTLTDIFTFLRHERLTVIMLMMLAGSVLSSYAQQSVYELEPDPEEEIEEELILEEMDREVYDNTDLRNYPTEQADSVKLTRHDRNWWDMLKRGKFDANDTTIVYPKFLNFCMKVYRWADKAFNGVDPDYIEGTGKRWKARLLSDNWNDSYALNIRDQYSIRMISDIYCNAGAYIQYMAVSVGYSLDLSNIIGNRPANHKKLGFAFSCARFTAELHYEENSGGTVIRKFNRYDDNKLIRADFPGLTLHTYGLDAYYFFNNKRYSQGAAYSYSKIQKRSQGSGIIGFSYNYVNIGMDFNKFPDPLKAVLDPEDVHLYRYHYNSYCLLTGYGHNFVAGKHVLFNLTVLPKVGIAKCYDDSLEANKTMLSLGILSKGSMTINLGNFFINVTGSLNGSWYRSRSNSFFSSINNGSMSAGIRF